MNFRNNLFPCLLNNIFKLMPVEVLQDNKNKAVKLLEIFTTTPSFNFGGTINIDYILLYRLVYHIVYYYRKLDRVETGSYRVLVVYKLPTASASIG